MQAPMRLRPRCSLLVGLCALLYGCAFATRQDIADLKAAIRDLEARDNEKNKLLNDKLDREKMLREVDMRRVSSHVECHNDKVRDFIKECEEGSDVCSEQGLANAYRFMITQPYVQIYLKPRAGIDSLVATRKGQLTTMGDPKNWLPSTRFLVLAQPRSESGEHREEALRLGREVQRYLVNELFAEEKGVRILGPKILPCKMKADELNQHVRGKLDLPVKGEPTGKDASVRLWVFRTDC